MPYAQNLVTSIPMTNTEWLWDRSLNRWYVSGSSTSNVFVREDIVASATKRPLPKGFKPPSVYDRWVKNVSLDYAAKIISYQNGIPYSMVTGPRLYVGVRDSLPSAVPSSIWTSMHYEALHRVKGQALNLGTTLAEMPSTLRLIRDTTKAVAQSIRLAKRGRFIQAAESIGLDPRSLKSAKSWSSKWLTIQYGWSPLLSDVDSAMKLIAGGSGWHYGVTVKRPYPYGGTSNSSVVTCQRSGKRFLKLRLDFEIDQQKLATYSSMGLTNPAEVAWELVPFSFVADWFVPIGDYLHTLDIGMFANFKGGSRTDFWVVKDVCTSKRSTGSFRHVYRDMRLVRTPILSMVAPRPPLPDFSLGLKQAISGLSLLIQAVSGRDPRRIGRI